MATRNHRRVHSNNHMEEIREQATSIGQSVRAMAVSAGEAATDSLGPVEEYVRQKPMKALLMAAGAGCLFGFLFMRR